MAESIFTKIIRGEIACHKIYEDEQTFAFLDKNPKQPGHVLVIPKQQVEFVWDLEPQSYASLMETVRKVALRIKEVFHPPYVGEQIVGTDVPHAHVHVFPFANTDEYNAPPDTTLPPEDKALAELAAKLAF